MRRGLLKEWASYFLNGSWKTEDLLMQANLVSMSFISLSFEGISITHYRNWSVENEFNLEQQVNIGPISMIWLSFKAINVNHQKIKSIANEFNLAQNGKLTFLVIGDSFVFLKKYYLVYLLMVVMLLKITLAVRIHILFFHYDKFDYSSIKFMFIHQ